MRRMFPLTLFYKLSRTFSLKCHWQFRHLVPTVMASCSTCYKPIVLWTAPLITDSCTFFVAVSHLVGHRMG